MPLCTARAWLAEPHQDNALGNSPQDGSHDVMVLCHRSNAILANPLVLLDLQRWTTSESTALALQYHVRNAWQKESLHLPQVACRHWSACSCPSAALTNRQTPVVTALEQGHAPQDVYFAQCHTSARTMRHQMAAMPEIVQSAAKRQQRTRIERLAT